MKLQGVPKDMQRQWKVAESECASFVQTNANPYNYRDAVRFPNGTEVLLQNVPTGISVLVLSLDSASAMIEGDIEISAF
ncbi:MAG TPA: hypothetical protein VG273_13585 [Bryobacteraceae bacterium]|nr:hypothetical protein [Bryobacteraceae bacterium]